MKKLYLITIILLLAQVTYAVNVEIDNIAYNINLKTGFTEVTSNALHPYTGNIVIPEEIVYEGKEYTVTAIGKSAFFSM